MSGSKEARRQGSRKLLGFAMNELPPALEGGFRLVEN